MFNYKSSDSERVTGHYQRPEPDVYRQQRHVQHRLNWRKLGEQHISGNDRQHYRSGDSGYGRHDNDQLPYERYMLQHIACNGYSNAGGYHRHSKSMYRLHDSTGSPCERWQLERRFIIGISERQRRLRCSIGQRGRNRNNYLYVAIRLLPYSSSYGEQQSGSTIRRYITDLCRQQNYPDSSTCRRYLGQQHYSSRHSRQYNRRGNGRISRYYHYQLSYDRNRLLQHEGGDS